MRTGMARNVGWFSTMMLGSWMFGRCWVRRIGSCMLAGIPMEVPSYVYFIRMHTCMLYFECNRFVESKG